MWFDLTVYFSDDPVNLTIEFTKEVSYSLD